MKVIKRMLPAILLIAFEIALGIILLVNPEGFTTGVFVIFGSVLILCALIMMIRYFRERGAVRRAFEEAKRKAKWEGKPVDSVEQPKVSVLPLVTSIVTFIFGAMFAFGASALYQLTLLLVIFYGAIMIIKGIFKITEYVSLRREKLDVSPLRLAVGILSAALGVVMIIFSNGARNVLFTVAAISLFIEAALDIVTIFQSGRNTSDKQAKLVNTSAEEKK